jgi:murein DD-endopeptidase MepM/ murein hydrolase activator NlpD
VQHRPPTGSYRGRRRVPTPPRSRYAAVVTTAFVGAGVVALGASTAMPNLKTANYASGDVLTAGSLADLADRQKTVADRASRADDRSAPLTTASQGAPDFWQLPLKGYSVSSGFGWRWGRLHAGVDLAAPHGTPIYAAASGTVIMARWYGGYGNCVIVQHPDGVVSLYGHQSKIIATEGQHVDAGQLLGLVGDTGHSFGDHLHFEIRINDNPTEPLAFMRQHGVDVSKHIEILNGGQFD